MGRRAASVQGEKFERFLKVFDALHRTRRGVTSQELANDLGVDVRSVQRYLRQMENAGFDIRRDEQHRARFGEGTRLPPLQFLKTEGVAILVALRLLQQMGVSRDLPLLSALTRLAGAMQQPSVTAYLATMLHDLETRPDGGARERIANVVVECFAERWPCEIEYQNARGEVSRRVVRTYYLEPRPECRTVFAYADDEKSKQLRAFRMDRIRAARQVKVLGTYSVPADFDIADVTRSSWGVWLPGDELDEVVLRFCPEAVERVRQSPWHESMRLTDLPGGGVEMCLEVASEIEMRPWVLGWGSQVEVVRPQSLRDHAAASMRAGARMYDSHLSPG